MIRLKDSSQTALAAPTTPSHLRPFRQLRPVVGLGAVQWHWQHPCNDAQSWTDWLPGRHGLTYQTWADVDALRAELARLPGHAQAVEVPLACGVRLPILPAPFSGWVLGLDGQPTDKPASAYGRAARAFADGERTDRALIDLVQHAATSVWRVPAELIAAAELISSNDLEPIILAVYGRHQDQQAGDAGKA